MTLRYGRDTYKLLFYKHARVSGCLEARGGSNANGLCPLGSNSVYFLICLLSDACISA